jgi:hypothetical protein
MIRIELVGLGSISLPSLEADNSNNVDYRLLGILRSNHNMIEYICPVWFLPEPRLKPSCDIRLTAGT